MALSYAQTGDSWERGRLARIVALLNIAHELTQRARRPRFQGCDTSVVSDRHDITERHWGPQVGVLARSAPAGTGTQVVL